MEKPKWIYLGKFRDTQNFSPEARVIYDRYNAVGTKEHRGRELEYYILFSMDGKRVVRIKTTSIDYPWLINNKPVKQENIYTGPIILELP